ncbi:hypothetical protein F5Y18DRAFT_425345 [Xylariaceae sp. FL1019]|nr:hypothetical protein F5Y18DRAFT_425345 [Xylariaceae sp. FL1019]
MAGSELHIGPCQLETGRLRHRVPPHIAIPWEAPATTFEPFMFPADEEELEDTETDNMDDSDSASDEESDGAHDPADEAAVEGDNTGDISNEDENELPGVGQCRLNLTSLSQRYNMYVVAYKGTIHGAKPPPSEEARHVTGHMVPLSPHQVNQLVVGELGDKEVLILAYDDGDIIAYYVDHLETELLNLESVHPSKVRRVVQPFFHENVAKSAWGVAVHKESRLIAVGTNRHEVHVFAFGIKNSAASSQPNVVLPHTLFQTIVKDHHGEIACSPDVLEAFRQDREPTIFRPESQIPRRFNWRIIFKTGPNGTNIPNVSFGSNEPLAGHATHIIAIDISGKLWRFALWTSQPSEPDICTGLHEMYRNYNIHRPGYGGTIAHYPRGWGVLFLPESSFLTTKDFHDSLGLSPAEAVRSDIGRYIDTKRSLQHINNNSSFHPWIRSRQMHRFFDPSHIEAVPYHNDWYHVADKTRSWSALKDSNIDQQNVRSPASKRQMTVELETKNTKRPSKVVEKKTANSSLQKMLSGSEYSIMRTYETGIELCGGNGQVGVMLDHAIYQTRPRRGFMPGLAWAPERLGNLVHIPELFLVAAGSLCGRVALITLTRPMDSRYSFRRGFKIEAILPTAADEDKFLRPICPLLGVAVGPIHSSGNDDPFDARRYRIMIHYYDLRILSYEIYRDPLRNEICIV